MHHARIILLTAVAASAIACGASSSAPPPKPPETTSAAFSVAAPAPVAVPAQLDRSTTATNEADRTDALDRDKAAEKIAAVGQKREYDDLEVRVIESIENADLALQGLRDDDEKNQFKHWFAVDKATRKAARHKAKLLSDLRRLHGDLGNMSWPVFKAGVESSIGDLDAIVAQAKSMKY